MDGHAMVFSGRSDCVFFCLLFFSAQRSFLPTPLWRLCFSLHNHARRRLEGFFFKLLLIDTTPFFGGLQSWSTFDLAES
jgi:hypothetical protein